MEIVKLVLQIIELAAILGALGFLAYRAGKLLLPLLKNPDFLKLLFDAIAKAEEKFPDGHGNEKLEMVVDFLIDFCAEHKIDFTLEQLTRLVNLTVAAINLIKRFIKV